MTDNLPTSGDPATSSTLFQQQDQKADDNKGLELSKEQLAAILKQNSHAQSHIKTIEDENKQLKDRMAQMAKELEMSTQFDDLLEGLANPQRSTNTSEQTAPRIDKNELLSELKQEIFNELTTAQVVAAQQQNLQNSIAYVQQRFGETYETELRNVAAELSLDENYLEDLARTSPKAFQTMVESVRPSKTSFGPTTTSLRTTPGPTNPNYDIAALAAQKRMNTPEGRQAKELWNSDDFQRSTRQRILEEARAKGSKFGNQI